MQGDGARPNLFDVVMPFPSAIVPNAGQAMTKLNFMARTSQIPGSTLGMVPLYYFGRDTKVPGNRVFPDWTTTIINDEDFVVRRAIEQWMNGINSHRGNLRNPSFRNISGYSVNANVTQYGKAGDLLKQYRFEGLWPMDLSPIDLDWGANDTIEEYTVVWQYQQWVDVRSGVV